MSLQWTFIAGYLYFEIAVVIIMILPIFSPRRWHQFFRSSLFAMFQHHAALYFYAFLGVLTLFLMDAIREMRKYSNNSEPLPSHLSTEMKSHVKLFRAQRNFYITSFAIFLAFVIKRLVTMLIIQYELEQKAEKIIKQAEETVSQAKKALLDNDNQLAEAQNYKEIKNVLEVTENLLEEEKLKTKELEEEATKWRLKYEQLETSSGKGDE
ncbi:PREDICTED: B-cell receptor-associated protein 31-like [Papilio polytes]|uniref:B-cell receptor-associated protein 31-like n=1 Tax=Papilio polytes TaxID=76194 RepID=UPI0006768196|nr:PREDICTED: B-cell receptor-associated protein 31-like [Papilio polytes]